jgi:hypothetical protein
MTPKTTAFAQMAMASVKIAATVNPGDLRNCGLHGEGPGTS